MTIPNAILRMRGLILSVVFLTVAAMLGEAEFATYFRLDGLLGSLLVLIILAVEMLGYIGAIVEITRYWTLG